MTAGCALCLATRSDSRFGTCRETATTGQAKVYPQENHYKLQKNLKLGV